MTHDLVMDPVLELLAADGELTGIVGTAIYESGERDFEVPSLEWTLIVETPDAEVFDRIQVQFDAFVRSREDLLAVQRRVEQLLDHETEWEVGGLRLRSRKLDIRKNPTEEGIYSGSVDIEFKPVREHYHRRA